MSTPTVGHVGLTSTLLAFRAKLESQGFGAAVVEDSVCLRSRVSTASDSVSGVVGE